MRVPCYACVQATRPYTSVHSRVPRSCPGPSTAGVSCESGGVWGGALEVYKQQRVALAPTRHGVQLGGGGQWRGPGARKARGLCPQGRRGRRRGCGEAPTEPLAAVVGVSRGAGDRLASGHGRGAGGRTGEGRGGGAAGDPAELLPGPCARCCIGALVWGQRPSVLVAPASEACWGSRVRPTFPRGLGGVRAAWGTVVSSPAPPAAP